MPKIIRACALLAVLAVAAAAQTSDWTAVKGQIGTSVRVSVGSRTVTGRLFYVRDDSLAVDSGKGPEIFQRQQVTRIRVKKQGHRGRNTLIGLGVGAASGAVIGAATHKDCAGFCLFRSTREEDTAGGAVVLGIIGAVVGAVLPTGGWREIYKQ